MAHHNTNPDRDYDRLQQALDRQVTGAPASAAFTQILHLLYAPEEAALAARLPVRPARLETLARQLGRPPAELDAQLTRLADRGLVLDLSTDRGATTPCRRWSSASSSSPTCAPGPTCP